MKKILKWGGIALVALIVIGAISGGGKTTSQPSSGTKPSSTSAKDETVTYKIGDSVTVGEVKWRLVEAKDRGTTLKAAESRYKGISKDKPADGNEDGYPNGSQEEKQIVIKLNGRPDIQLKYLQIQLEANDIGSPKGQEHH